MTFAKLKVVNASAFEGCAKLATPTLAEAVEFGAKAFYGCAALTKPSLEKVTKFGSSAFATSGIQEIKFAADVAEIPESVCEGCDKLAKISFDDAAKVTKVGKNAFAATKITEIVIPKSVTEIGDDCFKGCAELASVTYKGETPIENSIFAECKKLTVAGIKLEDTYKSLVFGGFSICEVSGDEGSFHYAVVKGESKLTLTGAPMPEIANDKAVPWDKCRTVITEVVFGDEKVTSISARAFQNHIALEKITIPNVITKIPDYAFDGCVKLSDLVLHDSITDCGKYSFRKCEMLNKDLVIPAGVATIMEGAFRDCTSITKVSFGAAKKASKTLADAESALTTIGDQAFAGCTNLAEVELPSKLTTIGGSTFSDTGLKSIVVPASVKEIGDNCFKGCKSLTNFEYLGTTEIKNNIFADSNPSIKVPEDYPSDEFGGKKIHGGDDPSEPGLSKGAIAGIVIGVLVVVVIIVVIGVLAAKGKLGCQRTGSVSA